MNGPNPELMAAYETDAYYLEKSGQVPPLGELLEEYGPRILSMGLATADHGHQERLLLEAEIMNEMFRQHEHARMAATVEGFKGASADLVKFASELGKKLAHQMEKEALVGLSPDFDFKGMVDTFSKTRQLLGGAAATTAAKSAKAATGLGLKNKLLLGGAALGAGYAGYKGLQTARDYMLQPAHSQTWGKRGLPLPANVNEYGTPY